MPRMASGKTLPCFAPFDAGARSGGFIGDRFLSGLRPQVRWADAHPRLTPFLLSTLTLSPEPSN